MDYFFRMTSQGVGIWSIFQNGLTRNRQMEYFLECPYKEMTDGVFF